MATQSAYVPAPAPARGSRKAIKDDVKHCIVNFSGFRSGYDYVAKKLLETVGVTSLKCSDKKLWKNLIDAAYECTDNWSEANIVVVNNDYSDAHLIVLNKLLDTYNNGL